jgi:hypothetical protein
MDTVTVWQSSTALSTRWGIAATPDRQHRLGRNPGSGILYLTLYRQNLVSAASEVRPFVETTLIQPRDSARVLRLNKT